MLLFLHAPASTEIYTLSLHDALPICRGAWAWQCHSRHRRRWNGCWSIPTALFPGWDKAPSRRDRKSTRLNSSHVKISYAVFCLKKKKKKITLTEIVEKAFDDRLQS